MATMSKRAQARTERELHDLLRAPGNTTCADCGARNPSWASWNLGVFLCMRCASIHRKLGTHISKVKSLSMDQWTNEQLENMKKNGNLAVNKVYNPKNKRPDMPLDVDEADGAMERFIRKKYQEKSLSDGRPEVPSRDNEPPSRPKSPEASPPPALPVKKGRFFGFGLRASSSAYPLSKHDKKGRNEPRVDNAFRISSENYTSSSRNAGSRSEMSDHELQAKLAQLRDMGFTDTERNSNILKRVNGDVERAVATIVKLGPSDPAPSKKVTAGGEATGTAVGATTNTSQTSTTRTSGPSLNPFDQLDQQAPTTTGLTLNNAPAQAAPVNTNPWQTAMSSQQPTGFQQTTGLEQSFSNMQVTTPSYGQNSGGYYPQTAQYSNPTSPYLQGIPQQYTNASSPASMSNPFTQAPLSAHSTGSNPYAAHMQQSQPQQPAFAPSTNPFMNMSPAPATQQTVPPQGFNPFGLPPGSPSLQQQSQPSVFDAQPNVPHTGPQSSHGGMQHFQQPQFVQINGAQSPSAFPNFQYGQPQMQALQQPSTVNPQFQPMSYQQQQQQQQPLSPQQTGRYDKNSILALYNYPQHAPTQPLASIPEPTNDQNLNQQAFAQHQMISPAPSAVYGGVDGANPPRRSATMPASTMHSAGGMGSRNPFMNSANSSGASTPAMPPQQFNAYPQGFRHASAESMSVNNPNLMDGRHSPDAFASLSARYGN